MATEQGRMGVACPASPEPRIEAPGEEREGGEPCLMS